MNDEALDLNFFKNFSFFKHYAVKEKKTLLNSRLLTKLTNNMDSITWDRCLGRTKFLQVLKPAHHSSCRHFVDVTFFMMPEADVN
jgi:hypothetical protein